MMLRAFGRFESYDLITFGGEGAGPPGDSSLGGAGQRRKRRGILFRFLN